MYLIIFITCSLLAASWSHCRSGPLRHFHLQPRSPSLLRSIWGGGYVVRYFRVTLARSIRRRDHANIRSQNCDEGWFEEDEWRARSSQTRYWLRI